MLFLIKFYHFLRVSKIYIIYYTSSDELGSYAVNNSLVNGNGVSPTIPFYGLSGFFKFSL